MRKKALLTAYIMLAISMTACGSSNKDKKDSKNATESSEEKNDKSDDKNDAGKKDNAEGDKSEEKNTSEKEDEGTKDSKGGEKGSEGGESDSDKSEENKGTSGNAGEYATGSYVYFGTYEQDNNTDNGKEKIKWEVVDEKDGKFVLVSAYVIDYLEKGEVKDMYKTAFNVDEKAAVEKNGTANISSISKDNAITYFEMNKVVVENYSPSINDPITVYFSEKALGVPTPYVMKMASTEEVLDEEKYNNLAEDGITYDKSVIGRTYIEYWTSTPITSESTYTVDELGRISEEVLTLNNGNEKKNGIRPMVMVNADKAAALFEKADAADEAWMIEEPDNAAETVSWEVSGNKLIIKGSDGDKIPSEWKKDAPWKESAADIEIVEISGVKRTDDIFEDLPALKEVYIADDVKVRDNNFEDCPDGLIIHYKGVDYDKYSIGNI